MVSAFESPVVTVNEWPEDVNDDIISARLIFPVVTCVCTCMLVGERISGLVSRVARIGVCTSFLYLLVVLEVF